MDINNTITKYTFDSETNTELRWRIKAVANLMQLLIISWDKEIQKFAICIELLQTKNKLLTQTIKRLSNTSRKKLLVSTITTRGE